MQPFICTILLLQGHCLPGLFPGNHDDGKDNENASDYFPWVRGLVEEDGAQAHGGDDLDAGNYAGGSCSYFAKAYEIKRIPQETPDQAYVKDPYQLFPPEGRQIRPTGGQAFDQQHPEYAEELDIEEKGRLFHERCLCRKASHKAVKGHGNC